ncbi:precorrin-6y C5,15-methyltransferase (decarboxylating) subunit CbiE [Lichenicola sp.]|uniref:precorrin-6y C5,15-methyltransferase (decarboxylating) subunit CbiE n=1 Tax=Lichenicola sp. TaxID=2804529 RepID=UPI003B005E33
MLTSTPWLAILGIGEDGVEPLSPAARMLIGGATLVVGGRRHLSLAEALIRGETMAWPSPIADGLPAILARRGQPVVVLASGDPFCFGIGSLIAAHVATSEMLCLPAPSAVSLACARLGWSMQDTGLLSICGRPIEALLPALQPGARLLVLSADETSPDAVASQLRARGFGGSTLHVLEALGGPRERHRSFRADQPVLGAIARLNLLAIEVVAGAGAQVIPLGSGLPDDMFEHDGQLTKREIRAVTLSALAPRQGETLWDIGSGSGAISIEWMRHHPCNRAIAIERRPDRADRAMRNALALGVTGLRVVSGAAPDALAGLPAPGAVFIGGGASAPGVLDAAWDALGSGGRLVVNAVTIETEALLFAAHAQHGGTLTRLSVERLDLIGGMHGFRPSMTVTQYAACKP